MVTSSTASKESAEVSSFIEEGIREIQKLTAKASNSSEVAVADTSMSHNGSAKTVAAGISVGMSERLPK